MKKNWLYTTVERLLTEEPQLRNDDNALELRVCREWNGKLFAEMKADEFMSLRHTLGFPSRDYISKTRRLVQANNKDLRG